MELEQLKKAWEIQENRIDEIWNINFGLLRDEKLGKVKSKMNHQRIVTAITLSFYLLSAMFFANFAVQYYESMSYLFAGIILTIWCILIASGSIRQLILISKIDYAKPVPLLQKQLEHLKLILFKYFRLAIWILPFYMTHFIFWMKVIMDIDLVAVADSNWLIAQVVMSIAFIPLTVWINSKLQLENINKRWMKNILRGNGTQIIEAMNLIRQIEKFEKSE